VAAGAAPARAVRAQHARSAAAAPLRGALVRRRRAATPHARAQKAKLSRPRKPAPHATPTRTHARNAVRSAPPHEHAGCDEEHARHVQKLADAEGDDVEHDAADVARSLKRGSQRVGLRVRRERRPKAVREQHEEQQRGQQERGFAGGGVRRRAGRGARGGGGRRKRCKRRRKAFRKEAVHAPPRAVAALGARRVRGRLLVGLLVAGRRVARAHAQQHGRTPRLTRTRRACRQRLAKSAFVSGVSFRQPLGAPLWAALRGVCAPANKLRRSLRARAQPRVANGSAF
jgi:hypothetical protein